MKEYIEEDLVEGFMFAALRDEEVYRISYEGNQLMIIPIRHHTGEDGTPVKYRSDIILRCLNSGEWWETKPKEPVYDTY